MESKSARLECEVEETRWQLTGTLEELRGRMTPGQVVDQIIVAKADITGRSALMQWEEDMGRGILLWLLGVPIPVIILLALLWH
jgi:hypothetical protein